MDAMTQSQDDDVNLLDYWRVIWKHRWMISGLFVGSVLVAAVVSFQMPKIYESKTTLLPSLDSKDSSIGGLANGASNGGGLPNLGTLLPGASAPQTDFFVAMLQSRVMADEVIKRFNLMDLYKSDTTQDARKSLEAATTIMVTKLKVVSITVEAQDPKLAADIANFYVANLERLNQTLKVTKASQNRAFLERRLIESQISLVKAEETFKAFQTHNKTIALDAQSKAMLTAASAIQGQISANEVKFEVMSGYLSHDNPQLSDVRSTIDELKKQLYLMESGKGGKGMLPGDRLHPAMVTVPSLSLGYGRLFREFKTQEALYTLLISQLEQAKLAEARDTPTVNVLDPAIPAEKKSKPIIWRNMIIVGVLSLFLSIFLAFFLEHLARPRSSSFIPQ